MERSSCVSSSPRSSHTFLRPAQPTDVGARRVTAAARGQRLVAYRTPAPAAIAPVDGTIVRTSRKPGAELLASADSAAAQARGETSLARSGGRAVHTASTTKGAAGR